MEGISILAYCINIGILSAIMSIIYINSEARYQVWKTKTVQSKTKKPRIESIRFNLDLKQFEIVEDILIDFIMHENSSKSHILLHIYILSDEYLFRV